MANEGKIADVLDAVTGVLDNDSALSGWLTPREGKKYYYTAADKIPTDISNIQRPALLVWVAEIQPEMMAGGQVSVRIGIRLRMEAKRRDIRELLDLVWHVLVAAWKQPALAPFGLQYVWRRGFGPIYLLDQLRTVEDISAEAPWVAETMLNVDMHFKPQEE